MTRKGWPADSVVVVDLGDHVVARPASVDPVGALRGKYMGGRSSDDHRRDARAEDGARESRSVR